MALKTSGGTFATKNRRDGLKIFEDYLSRPWLGCELSLELESMENSGRGKRREYSIPELKKEGTSYDVDVDTSGNASFDRTMIITGLTVPELGLGFVANTALAGHIQPQIQFGNVQVKFVIPATIQTKRAKISEAIGASNIGQNLGIFGSLYESQFTTYGTLRLNKSKPNILVVLSNDIRPDTVDYNSSAINKVILLKLKGCSFTMPVPSGGDASDLNALTFGVSIAFDDYVIFNGTLNDGSMYDPNNVKAVEMGSVGVSNKRGSFIETVARTKITEGIAKKMALSIGKGLGFKL